MRPTPKSPVVGSTRWGGGSPPQQGCRGRAKRGSSTAFLQTRGENPCVWEGEVRGKGGVFGP